MAADDKTEQATPKRREDARKKGQIFLSQEVVTVATLIAAFYGAQMFMPSILAQAKTLIEKDITLGAATETLTMTNVQTLLLEGLLVLFQAAVPLMGLVCLAAIVATMGQTRLYISSQGFAFKGDRLNPLNGIKHLFSAKGLVDLLKALLKIVILAYLIYSVLRDAVPAMAGLFQLSVAQAAEHTGSLIMTIVNRAVIAFAALSAADFFFQWWEYEKSLRMSKQEIKDEYKETEGDPQIKGRQRNIAQQRARRRMMQKVPEADVVIRNPTHLAVAIQYNRAKDHAPRVIAKGADDLAMRIVRVAEEHHIQTVEDVPLAHALYDAVDLDKEIPEQYYQPVAKILAFVYGLKNKSKEQKT